MTSPDYTFSIFKHLFVCCITHLLSVVTHWITATRDHCHLCTCLPHFFCFIFPSLVFPLFHGTISLDTISCSFTLVILHPPSRFFLSSICSLPSSSPSPHLLLWMSQSETCPPWVVPTLPGYNHCLTHPCQSLFFLVLSFSPPSPSLFLGSPFSLTSLFLIYVQLVHRGLSSEVWQEALWYLR